MKRMHFLRRLIFGGFQRGVPRRIGRTIRGTLSNGVKIIDAFRARLELGVKITNLVQREI